jgi:hypothetical protein
MPPFPSDEREQFLDLLDRVLWLDSPIEDADAVETMTKFGDCSDILPAEYCIEICIPLWSTYADAARTLMGANLQRSGVGRTRRQLRFRR